MRCWERGEDQGQRRRAALEKTVLREREDEVRHRERIGWTDGTVDGWMRWRGMFDGPIWAFRIEFAGFYIEMRAYLFN